MVEEAIQDRVVNSTSMKDLYDAGVHFGHQKSHWNPKMKSFIFTQRNGIHIIDLRQTYRMLDKSADFISKIGSQGKKIMIVGTKRQAHDSILKDSARSGAFYVITRWLGGTLTNFKTIKQRIDYLYELEERKEKGEFDQITKKESLKLEESINKLNRFLGGIKEMKELPGAIIVIDVRNEHIAISEAKRVGVPIIGLVDSDSNPENIDYPIPGNDDAIRSIQLVTSRLADAYLEGVSAASNKEDIEMTEELIGSAEVSDSLEENVTESSDNKE